MPDRSDRRRDSYRRRDSDRGDEREVRDRRAERDRRDDTERREDRERRTERDRGDDRERRDGRKRRAARDRGGDSRRERDVSVVSVIHRRPGDDVPPPVEPAPFNAMGDASKDMTGARVLILDNAAIAFPHLIDEYVASSGHGPASEAFKIALHRTVVDGEHGITARLAYRQISAKAPSAPPVYQTIVEGPVTPNAETALHGLLIATGELLSYENPRDFLDEENLERPFLGWLPGSGKHCWGAFEKGVKVMREEGGGEPVNPDDGEEGGAGPS